MLKISKPVLMNDFIVSPVQFTSLNLVSFKNIKPVYDGNEKILLEFEHPSKIDISSRDWIGIFPRGWSSLQQYVTFEWISQSVPFPVMDQNKENGEVIKRTIAFCPKYHMNCVNQSALYQFVYVGKQIEVLGVSSYFRFDLTCVNDSNLELECLVPVNGKIRSTSVSDFGTISMTNELSSTSIDSRKLIQTSSIHSLQNLDTEGKLSWSRMNFTDDKKNLCLMKRAALLPSGTGDNLDPYSSHSEPVFPMSLSLTQCKKCSQFKRGGDILRSQQVLQSKVGPSLEEASRFIYHWKTHGKPYFVHDKLKIVMERNKVLEERTQEMKKELERLQSESKKIKMSHYNINKEKVAYEKFVKDFIKSLEKDSIVRVMYGNTEILVKKVNYVGMEEHPRDKKTSKRERELKAVIGLQEITIRNLINSLQEKAKSVEELNQTVKLAQVFSSARVDSRVLEIDAEESSDEISNSDATSEYEFSLTKPQPPEEVVGDTDDVLDNIRKASEIELKNIGITRSLGKCSDSDLDVTNLSVMSYDSDDAMSKKPRLEDNVEDCWPFSKPLSKTTKKKISGESMNLIEQKGNNIEENIPDPLLENEDAMLEDNIGIINGDVKNNLSHQDIEKDECETSVYEHFYDAYDAFSVRGYSPEPETCVLPSDETRKQCDVCNDESNEREKNEFLLTAIVPQKSENDAEFQVKAHDDNQIVLRSPPEKFNKFTCELSIDFSKKQCQPDGDMSTLQVVPSEQNVGALSQCDSVPFNESEAFSMDKERSLITFKKASKCLKIEITQMDQKENQSRGGFQQRMVVQFAPERNDEDASDNQANLPIKMDVATTPLIEGCDEKLLLNSASDFSANCESTDVKSYNSSPNTFSEFSEETNSQVPSEEAACNKEYMDESMEIDTSSPRTEWNDADEVFVLESTERDRYPESARRVDDTSEPTFEAQTAKEKAMLQLEEKKSEIAQEFLKSKCNIQMLTEDSMNNLKVYQDSLRYEKNLQFLNNKIDGNKEIDDETLKEKPSAILIQSGQAKVALIRYQ